MSENKPGTESKPGIAVVGVGGWGKNLARNYYQMGGADLVWMCDLRPKVLADLAQQLSGTPTTSDFEQVLNDPRVDAVVIATSAPTHYELAKAALLAGKDVYVEKPFVLVSEHAEELIGLARERDRILMVGHLLEYHPVVVALKSLVDSGELGKIRYIYCQRLNLGTVREEENALWNFAPHDISVVLHLLGKQPTDVSARGQCYLREGVEDVVFMAMNFGDQSMGHVHVSWLDPHKTRRIIVVGSRKMAVFDDLEANEKLKIYDKGADMNVDYDNYAEYVGLRFGDIVVPYIKMAEPLQLECRHFLDCIEQRRQPLSDGLDGLRVVKVLSAAQESLKDGGRPVTLSPELA